MLSFDLRSLESQASRVDGELPGNDPVWQEGDARPKGAIRVAGRLSVAGPGRFYFSGRMEGMAVSECRRCLEPVESAVQADLQLLLVDASADEAEEADVYLVDVRQRELDLRPAIREEWLLAAPSFLECSDSCRGLCPSCGANLNHGACGCAPATDPRWTALSSLGGDTR
jgi:uncharacterized protein